MPALDAFLKEKLATLEAKAQKRTLKGTVRRGVEAERAGQVLVSFSCNDYLGLTRHPEVIRAAQNALQQYGAGAGASRLITGNNPLYDELESVLADYKKTEAACVFGSGYLANIGVIPALVAEGDLVIADKLSHACMLDGAKLSGAKLMRFAHNDLAHCRTLLESHRGEYKKCLILTETVFSMDGDVAPVAELSQVTKEYDSWLLTDDAHGFGLTKPEKMESHLIQIGTLSKAAGSYGGYVCGSNLLIDTIKTTARSLIYSTALPPAILASSLAALRITQREPERTAKPLEHARYFTSLMGLPEAQSAIVPVLLGGAEKALQLSKELEEEGFLVAAIRPPTVPENTARLRVAFSALHTKEQIEKLASLLRVRGYPCAS